MNKRNRSKDDDFQPAAWRQFSGPYYHWTHLSACPAELLDKIGDDLTELSDSDSTF